jgi:hypothetical protein
MISSEVDGRVRKLPSADWVAVGLAMLGLVLGRLSLPLTGILGLAVFGPALLREVGLLGDSDEWMRSVMHRAGFHAAVALALFIFLGRVLPHYDSPYPELITEKGVWFGPTFLWQTLVMVFLISYLIQYWGSVSGSARILMGFGCFLFLDGGVLAVRHGMWANVWPLGVSALFMLLLGWAALRWPRIIGGILLLICAVPLILWLTTRMSHWSTDMMARMVASMVHTVLVFGVTGAVLIRSARKEDL